MSLLEQIPASVAPFAAAVVAGVIGAILWRLFKLALKVVMFIVFCIVMLGVFAWWQPELFGIGKAAVEQGLGTTVDEAAKDLEKNAKDKAKDTAKDLAKETLNDALKTPGPAPANP